VIWWLAKNWLVDVRFLDEVFEGVIDDISVVDCQVTIISRCDWILLSCFESEVWFFAVTDSTVETGFQPHLFC